MMHWGALCPKRTTVWSSDGNSIHKLVPASFGVIFTPYLVLYTVNSCSNLTDACIDMSPT